MTSMNPLPPQAYTKDVFLTAYTWLQNQPEPIKEIACTPDILVSLYLKATRDGAAALERPSIQNFKSELKSLAGLMGDFEKLDRPEKVEKPSPRTTAAQTPVSNQNQAPQNQNHQLPAASAPLYSPNHTEAGKSEALDNTNQLLNVKIDNKSRELIRETQQLFNLSSEEEALRMLIKIAYTKAKDWMK